MFSVCVFAIAKISFNRNLTFLSAAEQMEPPVAERGVVGSNPNPSEISFVPCALT